MFGRKKPAKPPVYGAALEELMRDVDTLPPVLSLFIQQLTSHRVAYSEGLFRMSPTDSEVKKVRKAADESPDDINLSKYTPQAISAAFMLFFQSLKQPLLPNFLIDNLRAEPNRASGLSSAIVADWIDKFPPHTKTVFVTLIQLWQKLLQHSAMNRLNVGILTSAWAPSLFWMAGNRKEADPPTLGLVATFLMFCIDNADDVLSPPSMVSAVQSSGTTSSLESHPSSRPVSGSFNNPNGATNNNNVVAGGGGSGNSHSQASSASPAPMDVSPLIDTLEELRGFFEVGREAVSNLSESNLFLQKQVANIQSKVAAKTGGAALASDVGQLKKWKEQQTSIIEEIQNQIESDSREKVTLVNKVAEFETRLKKVESTPTPPAAAASSNNNNSNSVTMEMLQELREQLQLEKEHRLEMQARLTQIEGENSLTKSRLRSVDEIDGNVASLTKEVRAVRMKVDSMPAGGGQQQQQQSQQQQQQQSQPAVDQEKIGELVQNLFSTEKSLRAADYDKWKKSVEQQTSTTNAHIQTIQREIGDLQKRVASNMTSISELITGGGAGGSGGGGGGIVRIEQYRALESRVETVDRDAQQALSKISQLQLQQQLQTGGGSNNNNNNNGGNNGNNGSSGINDGVLSALRQSVQDIRDQVDEVRSRVGRIGDPASLVTDARSEFQERFLSLSSQLKRESGEIEALNNSSRQAQGDYRKLRADLEQLQLQVLEIDSSARFDAAIRQLQDDVRILRSSSSSSSSSSSAPSGGNSNNNNNNNNNGGNGNLEQIVGELSGTVNSMNRRVADLDLWRRHMADEGDRTREDIRTLFDDVRRIQQQSTTSNNNSSNSNNNFASPGGAMFNRRRDASDDESYASPSVRSMQETKMAIAEMRAELDDVCSQVHKLTESEDTGARRSREAVKRVERDIADLKNRMEDGFEQASNDQVPLVQRLDRLQRETEDTKKKMEDLSKTVSSGSGGNNNNNSSNSKGRNGEGANGDGERLGDDDDESPAVIVKALSTRIENALNAMSRNAGRSETQIRVFEDELADMRSSLRNVVEEEVRKRFHDSDSRNKRSYDAIKQAVEDDLTQLRGVVTEIQVETAASSAAARRLDAKIVDAVSRIHSEMEALEVRVEATLRDNEEGLRLTKAMRDTVAQLHTAHSVHVQEIEALSDDVKRVEGEVNAVKQQVLDAVLESATKSIRRLTELEEWRKRMTALADGREAPPPAAMTGSLPAADLSMDMGRMNISSIDTAAAGRGLRSSFSRVATTSTSRPFSALNSVSANFSGLFDPSQNPPSPTPSTSSISSSRRYPTPSGSGGVRSAWVETSSAAAAPPPPLMAPIPSSSNTRSSTPSERGSRSIDAWGRERGMDRAVERDLAELKRLFGV